MEIDVRVRPFINTKSPLYQIHPIPDKYLVSTEAFNRWASETYPDWYGKVKLGMENHPKGAEPFNLPKTYGHIQEIREYLKKVDGDWPKVKLGLQAYIEALEQDKQKGVKNYD